MGDIRSSLAAKVIAIFLSVLLLLAAVGSLGALAIGYEAGFYREENQSFEETELFEDLAGSIAYDVAAGYAAYGDPYYYVYSNGLGAEVRDADAGEVLFADVPADYRAAVTYTFPASDFAGGETPDPSTEAPPEGTENLEVTVYFIRYGSVFGYNVEAAYLFYRVVYPLRGSLPWIAFFSILAFFAVLVFLLCAAGHRRGSEAVVPNWLDRAPLDLLMAAVLALGGLNVGLVAELSVGGWVQIALVALLCVPLFLLGLLVLMTLATRLKLGRIWENTLCWKLGALLLRFCRRLWRGAWGLLRILPLTWRWVLAAGAVLLAQFLLSIYANWHAEAAFCLLLLDAALLAGTALLAWQLQKLKAAGQALADGDLETKADPKGMLWDLRTHAENLNAIGQGMNRAVEQRMKSERLKTELITNVSHDIKTPLTSIVNYVDLLKREALPPPSSEYVEVLDRQSRRLKKLTEDLVEASKASTGNIRTEIRPIVVNEIIHQAVGDYDRRLADGKLEVVVSTFEGRVRALADGRLLWRVLDNLLSNVSKYAQPGTRVYIDLKEEGEGIRLSVKNISRDPLNVDAEELTERFVRGDASRHTEGSGLGLNIARSLVELMGGAFRIAVDGDLFKAEILLPAAPAEEDDGAAAAVISEKNAAPS